MTTHEVHFEPDGLKVRVRHGTSLMEAAQSAGIPLTSTCGGAGTCGKCRVELLDTGETVLACQYPVERDLRVGVGEEARFFAQKILEEGIAGAGKVDPVVRKCAVQLAAPSLEDLRSDGRRLAEALAADGCCNKGCGDDEGNSDGNGGEGVELTLEVLRALPTVLREHDFSVTAVCHRRRVLAVEGGDTSGSLYGLAVDVGTTTVVASLVDLATGRTRAVASQGNPQVAFGDDIVSRIQYCDGHAEGLVELQKQVVGCLNDLIEQVCAEAAVERAGIYEVTAAGNATMQHLLLGVPASQIAQAPYVSGFAAGVDVPAAAVGLRIHEAGRLYVMPSVAAHVGGDTVAVALATAMRHSVGVNLALDIGTNGELVLGNEDRLLSCSTAAGPAFEGARILCGMRGAAGAIERVSIRPGGPDGAGEVAVDVIGGEQAAGLCGSGLIDVVAALLEAGLVDSSGRMLSAAELPAGLDGTLRERSIEYEGRPAFLLVGAGQSKHGRDIVLTQRDIREVQLATAAIRAGAAVLLAELGVGIEQVERLYLAGAFGNYIRPASGQRIGLLPAMAAERIVPVGNAASAGAKEVLISWEARRHAEALSRQIEYVELASRADFQMLFSEHMFFPEG